MGRKHRVAESELARIKQLMEAGWNIRDIALDIGRPFVTVSYHVKKLGRPPAFRRMRPEEIEYVRKLYFDEKRSLCYIQRLTGRNAKTLQGQLQKFGPMRTYAEAQLLANRRGYGQGIKNGGANNGMWKGGKIFQKDGYVLIARPADGFLEMVNAEGQISEHRYIMAKHLGRPLSPDEIVHHRNGIKTDNRLCNLALVSRNNHPTKTFMKQMQKRIRDLEAQLAQQKLDL